MGNLGEVLPTVGQQRSSASAPDFIEHGAKVSAGDSQTTLECARRQAERLRDLSHCRRPSDQAAANFSGNRANDVVNWRYVAECPVGIRIEICERGRHCGPRDGEDGWPIEDKAPIRSAKLHVGPEYIGEDASRIASRNASKFDAHRTQAHTEHALGQ